jgi:ribonuclease HI
MKQLKFEHQFAKAIQAGKKSATFRVNDDKNLTIDDRVQLIDKVDHDRPTTWLITGDLIIKGVEQRKLRDLTSEHMVRAESFTDTEEMLQTFRRFYGDHIDESTPVTIVTFQYSPYAQALPFVPQHTNVTVTSDVRLYADGGSRGNPGPSAAGFVILDTNDVLLHADNRYLGLTTNNQAEYHALIAGLEWCQSHNVRRLEVYMDSLLVVNQMKGIFKVKNRDLWALYERAQRLKDNFKGITFSHVPRAMNKLADSEVNKALDAISGSDIVQ